jgi:HAD superfamily hydrolase (TIGR01509 family)
MNHPILFLDDGGVLSDNRLRAPQWQRLVGEFFTPILGGAPSAWAKANRQVADQFFVHGGWQTIMESGPDYASTERRYYIEWLGRMCSVVGVRCPADEQCVELGLRAEAAIAPRVKAPIPGAAEVVRALRAAGYSLHTASGASSTMLGYILQPLGIRDCFGRLYGPDLINTHKNGPAYYQRLLADCGVTAGDALFVDDSPAALAWAAQTGARTVLVGQKPDAGDSNKIGSLTELPDTLQAARP